jgi:hypothetical protein
MHREFPRPPGRGSTTARAILTRGVVHVDIAEDPEYTAEALVQAGFRIALSVPMLRDGSPIGAISVAREEGQPFSDTQIALLQTFADQAVIAIENVRLFQELQARTAQLTRSVTELRALGEVGQAVSSTLDLETVLNTTCRVPPAAGADGASITSTTRHAGIPVRAAPTNPELVEAYRATPIEWARAPQGAVERREPMQVPDILRALIRAICATSWSGWGTGPCWWCRCCGRTRSSAR